MLIVMPSLPTLWFWNPAPTSAAGPLLLEWWRTPENAPLARRDRILEADPLGAEGGKVPGRPGARQLAGEVADPEMCQCCRAHVLLPGNDGRLERGPPL